MTWTDTSIMYARPKRHMATGSCAGTQSRGDGRKSFEFLKRGATMGRTLGIVAGIVLCWACDGRTWTQKASATESKALLDSLAKMKESRRAKDIESLHRLVNRVKEQEHVSIPDNASIRETIERMIEDEILGLTAAGRQELVKKTIGQEDYVMLERVFLKQLGSSDPGQQRGAIALLGYPLFALGAADQIKGFVLHSDRMTQYLALKSLVCLDVPGASSLLKDMIRARALLDYELSQAIVALYVSNDKGLDSLAMVLLQIGPGGMTFKSLLPILKKRADYREIVCQVFKSNMFYAPDEEGLPQEQLWKALAEHDLLREIFSAPESFVTDEAIKKKVLMYASTNHNGLYALALLTLEKSGQDLGFFTEMRKDNQPSAEKKRVLDLIVARIQRGERLK